MWRIVLEGLPIFWSNDLAGLILYYLKGVPFWILILLTIVKWSIFVLLAFYGTGWIFRRIEKFPRTKLFIERASQRINGLSQRIYHRDKENLHNKSVVWLLERKEWIVVLLAFVPYVPVIPTAVIVVVRLMKIKHGLFFLLLGSALKATVFCLTIHNLLPLS